MDVLACIVRQAIEDTGANKTAAYNGCGFLFVCLIHSDFKETVSSLFCVVCRSKALHFLSATLMVTQIM
jgi:hypothetical protein